MISSYDIIDHTSDVPTVCVAMLAYNHQEYISEAIESVLMQKTTFKVKIVIAEDCSTDDSRKIVIDYQKKFPHLIKLILQRNNAGAPKNNIALHENLEGKYVAALEGDDYWTDPLKLQKQVDFLEQNVTFSFSFHDVEIKNEVPGIVYKYPVPPKNRLRFRDILNKHYIATCSILFRRSMFTVPFPPFFSQCKMGDIPLELILASKGDVYYFNQKMAVYRKNEGGITLSLEQKKLGRKAYIFIYENILKFLFPKYLFVLTLKVLRTRAGYIKDYIK